jgi:hypothetical protein
MKRSCQRHTQVFGFPVRRLIPLVSTPSALNRTIDLSLPDMLMRAVAIPREHLKTVAINRLESDGNSGSHAPDL